MSAYTFKSKPDADPPSYYEIHEQITEGQQDIDETTYIALVVGPAGVEEGSRGSKGEEGATGGAGGRDVAGAGGDGGARVKDGEGMAGSAAGTSMKSGGAIGDAREPPLLPCS